MEYEDNLSRIIPGEGKGYGSMILDYVKGKNVNLDVEALDGDAENMTERLRRVEFYRRSGIVDTGYRLYDNGIKYMVLSSDPAAFNPRSFTRMWRYYLFGLFSEKLFRE